MVNAQFSLVIDHIFSMFLFYSMQKLLDACEEQNVEAYTDSVRNAE
jgi:hypothetical protein